MLAERIERFIRSPDEGAFDELALEAFALQYERIEPYRSLCDRRERTPGNVMRWDEVPLVPTLAFKSLELRIAEPGETFRSSGTTSAERSVHYHPYPELYRATIDAAFPEVALPTSRPLDGRVPMLSLVPGRDQAPDSSLSFMIDHVLTRWGDSSSLTAMTASGVDARALRAWLAARQRAGGPVLLLATALALLDALQALDRLGLRFRLPPGSLLFETGGYKGRKVTTTGEELERRVESALGIPSERIVREYGMTELTSQLYAGPADRGRGGAFVAPRWVRVRVLDPHSLEALPEGEVGMVAIFDLANLGSAVHVLTEDLGAIDSRGLELHGRAQGAELRGCSLTAEELAAR